MISAATQMSGFSIIHLFSDGSSSAMVYNFLQGWWSISSTHERKTAINAEPETLLLFKSLKKYSKVFNGPYTMCSQSEVARGHNRNLRCYEVINEVGTVVQWLALLPHRDRVLGLIPGSGGLLLWRLHVPKKGQLILKAKFPKVLISCIIFLLSPIIISPLILEHAHLVMTNRNTGSVFSLWSIPQGSVGVWMNGSIHKLSNRVTETLCVLTCQALEGWESDESRIWFSFL